MEMATVSTMEIQTQETQTETATVMNKNVLIINHQSSILDHQSFITDLRSPINNHQSLTVDPDHRSLIIDYQLVVVGESVSRQPCT